MIKLYHQASIKEPSQLWHTLYSLMHSKWTDKFKKERSFFYPMLRKFLCKTVNKSKTKINLKKINLVSQEENY